jgi:NAD(P)-dependent dehydrogenase (short-subunit alcohol dehydrogenase family)
MGSVAENKSGGYYGYRASKTALNMVSKCLALELKPMEITVIALHPGYVSTDMTSNQGSISTKESVDGMGKVIETFENSGGFYRFDGTVIPY